jgi:CPA2 family monovalent cation:H+ antiporter-2
MDGWFALLDILVLLLAAMVLGALCERLRQSAILGYLLAGMLLGPNAFNLMQNHVTVTTVAELGVALLLFSIGLEFSWSRLRSIGSIAFGGGTLQVVLTGAAGAGVCIALGLNHSTAAAVGAAIALSSTAGVLRILVNRAEIDSVYGRSALGILLLQDIAVVPLALLVTALGSGGSIIEIGWEMVRAAGLAVLLVGTLFVLIKYLVPRLLGAKEAARNRELPILFAIVTAVGAALISHKLNLSPVLGAFVAGMLLAESPFASQIRADVSPLRTLFVTLFFSSIGMLSNPAWILEHWILVAAIAAAVVFGKAIVVALVALLFRLSFGHSIATGICLAQVGEFSFVLAGMARQGNLIGGDLFELVVSVTVVTLFLTPYLIAAAPRIAAAAARLTPRGPRKLEPAETALHEPGTEPDGHIVIIGFGPAGQSVARVLTDRPDTPVLVVELNPRSAAKAQAMGLRTYIGDATRLEVLDHLHLGAARAVAVTAPDPSTARQIVAQIRILAPKTAVVARSRYHIYSHNLSRAGAHAVVDEEEVVGLQIASQVLDKLRVTD